MEIIISSTGSSHRSVLAQICPWTRPIRLTSATRRHPLSSINQYVMHFAKGTMPPAGVPGRSRCNDPAGFQVANPLNCFALNDWMPFHYNRDGSLDLYFQHAKPGADKRATLAAGAEGSLQPDDAELCAEGRCINGRMESAAGYPRSMSMVKRFMPAVAIIASTPETCTILRTQRLTKLIDHKHQTSPTFATLAASIM